ncbi:MAG: ABC transporter ATP-binding protein [Acutalibacteraceae bacterium]|nr:ABC transporter ATP-binding protein [Acutalibacteraceae bacterium]
MQRNPSRPPKGVPVPGQKIDIKSIKRLLAYLMKHKAVLIVVAVCIIISSLTGVASSIFLQILIDQHIMPILASPNPVFTGMLRLILVMCGIFIVGTIAGYLYTRLMSVTSQKVLKEIRDEMFEKMQKLPIKYFDTNTHGDIMSHYTNDTDTLRQMLSQSLPQMFSSIISIVSIFITMLTTSWMLTIVVLIFVVLMLFIVQMVAGKSGKYFVEQQKSLGDLNGYIEEMINGQKVIKVFCHEEKTKEEFNKKNDELFNNARNANSLANSLMPLMGNLGYLLYVILAIVGGILALTTGGITLGAIASFLNLSRSFMQPISQVAQQLNMVIMALAGAERIFNLMDEVPEVNDGYVTLVRAKIDGDKITECKERTGTWAWKHPHGDGTITYTPMKGEVILDDVDFSYVPDKPVLHNIKLYAKPGQKVAFVGSTGAGKTTITNLINRFYDIDDGKIRYDGININKINKVDLRHSLGIVLQDVNLFTGTIMENIRYGKLDATDEEVIAAANLANADDFIKMLPDGYNTMISGDGGSLSQGQKQLISIARAAVADPPVMILDEATSSIDTRTEAIVQAGMDSLMKGRTVFVIAHRLSTVKNSDVIIVLEHGRIIERGSHDDLIKQHGKYYQLYTGAFELE